MTRCKTPISFSSRPLPERPLIFLASITMFDLQIDELKGLNVDVMEDTVRLKDELRKSKVSDRRPFNVLHCTTACAFGRLFYLTLKTCKWLDFHQNFPQVVFIRFRVLNGAVIKKLPLTTSCLSYSNLAR